MMPMVIMVAVVVRFVGKCSTINIQNDRASKFAKRNSAEKKNMLFPDSHKQFDCHSTCFI